MEAIGRVIGRLRSRGRRLAVHAVKVDGAGYRLDCCDACPYWSHSRRVIVSHRVRCPVFETTVLLPQGAAHGS